MQSNNGVVENFASWRPEAIDSLEERLVVQYVRLRLLVAYPMGLVLLLQPDSLSPPPPLYYITCPQIIKQTIDSTTINHRRQLFQLFGVLCRSLLRRNSQESVGKKTVYVVKSVSRGQWRPIFAENRLPPK